MISFPARSLLAVVALVGSVLLTAPARGQIQVGDPQMQDYAGLPEAEDLLDVEIDSRLRADLDLLNDEDCAVRDAATQHLSELVGDRWQVYALLLREPLSEEQRQRLLEVVRRKLINTPRGAVGISMNWTPPSDDQPGSVEIIDLLPGLPAERVLQLRDRIVALDGKPLVDRNDLIRHVQRRLPGESVSITVHRPLRDETGDVRIGEDGQPLYEQVEVELTLGSAELLRDAKGGPVAESVVQRERQREAEGAVVRYGTVPRVVEVRPGYEGSFAINVQPLSDEVIDQHPVIQALLRQKEALERTGREIDPVIRHDWEQTLQILVDRMNRPGLGKAERQQLRFLVRRYQYHMQDGLIKQRADGKPSPQDDGP